MKTEILLRAYSKISVFINGLCVLILREIYSTQ